MRLTLKRKPNLKVVEVQGKREREGEIELKKGERKRLANLWACENKVCIYMDHVQKLEYLECKYTIINC